MVSCCTTFVTNAWTLASASLLSVWFSSALTIHQPLTVTLVTRVWHDITKRAEKGNSSAVLESVRKIINGRG